ncbi:MAG: hypothetical protein AAGI90_03205 [Chlamydiota bacterium]
MKKLKLIEMDLSEDLPLNHIKNSLRKEHACYVLITCKEPSEDGKMEVELSYEGDETLAAYLVESASEAFNHSADGKTNLR